jgi:MYXO-CTERM domain-containing protein
MNYVARRSGSPVSKFAFVALALICRSAAAQVIEPNGTSVPGPTTDITSLQTYFTSAGENINAVAKASITPATFMPLCDFQATLVLSQSNANGGLGWYNVPDATTDPNHTQTPTVYPIGTFPMVVGTVVGSSDIRSDPNYAGGLVGFALMKAVGTNGAVIPVYYSEDTRNADCTGCTMPGYWKMMLSYLSTQASNEYYMAWEDWEGANSTTWFGNDGDFNDKVFAITGVTCNGGGVPCQTNLPGVCANGITQCVVGGAPSCTQQVMPSAEKCDNLDNDCNGMVDDGDNLCPTGQTCVQGKCVGPCSDTEFPCGPPLVCVNGLCVDPSCQNVTCPTGQICQNGVCTGGCDGVVCPANQICELGICVDPCAGVTCKGTVCKLGVCIQSCSCAPCPSGQVCAASGACVDTGCDTMTCGAGQICSKGSCVDSCAGAKCPGGGTCQGGQCQPPTAGATGSGGGTGTGGTTLTTGAGGMIVTTTGAGGSAKGGSGGATGTGGTIPTGSGGATPGSGGAHQEGGVVSCACTIAGGGGHLAFVALFVVGGALLSRRRRARR